MVDSHSVISILICHFYMKVLPQRNTRINNVGSHLSLFPSNISQLNSLKTYISLLCFLIKILNFHCDWAMMFNERDVKYICKH